MSFKSFLTTHRLDQFHDRMVEYGADSLEDWMQYTTEEFDEAAQQIKMAGGHTTRLRKALDEQRASSSPPEQQQELQASGTITSYFQPVRPSLLVWFT